VVEIRSEDDPHDVIARFQDRIVYVGGGLKVWRAYADLICHWDITRLPYDGDADRWFDPSWLSTSRPSAVNAGRTGANHVISRRS
jgi:dihydromethanopterin reductase